MRVQDFPPRPDGADFDSAQHKNWLDALRNRQNIDALNTVSTVSSADETYLFSVSASKTYKATVQQLLTALNLTTFVSSLSADVPLTVSGQYFDGPQISCTGGTKYFVVGSVCFIDPNNARIFDLKMWDGTTTIDSLRVVTPGAGIQSSATLAGIMISPVGNVKISVNEPGDITGKLAANGSGNSQDCSILAVKIG